ncbi:MAG: bifunctional chorismate mutase/prephenate dehydrogenase [Geitlerinemataceae cyanobacterium]
MTNDKLQEIDRRLIKLLGERISLLGESNVPSVAEQLSQVKSQLTDAGVPEFVWQDVATSCTAALATVTPASPVTNSPKNVTIVGGKGVMGQFFQQRLSVAGHCVKTLGRKDWDKAEELLADADLVLICVPIDRTIEIIRDLAPYIPPSAVLADITSIKAPIVETMLACHSGPVVGLHPMFGPGVQSFLSQKVVICPGRNDEACQWLQDFMAADGGDLVVCTPEEHDRMMVAVQAIRHFSTFGLGVFLAEEGIDIGRSLELSSPIYRLGINNVSRLFGQEGSLYIEIMLSTEDRRKAIARLAETFVRLAQLVEHEDRSSLLDEFKQTTNTFGAETDRAVKESDRTIAALSVLLAADFVERRSRYFPDRPEPR